MKNFCLILMLAWSISSCNRKPNKETMELYEAYLYQYNSMRSLLSYVYQSRNYREETSNYNRYINDVSNYIEKNDSILQLKIQLNPHSIDSIKFNYEALVEEYKMYNPFSNYRKYIQRFPEFLGNETILEQEIKIKQSNIYLLYFFVISDYWLNKGERPYAPSPDLLYSYEKNDSVFYLFTYGINTFPKFHNIQIINDTLLSNDRIIENSIIIKENEDIFLNSKYLQKGKYRWAGDLLLYDRVNNTKRPHKETVEFEIK